MTNCWMYRFNNYEYTQFYTSKFHPEYGGQAISGVFTSDNTCSSLQWDGSVVDRFLNV